MRFSAGGFTEARWANEFYGHARDYVTEAGLWRHAKKTLTLEEGVNDREDDYRDEDRDEGVEGIALVHANSPFALAS